MMTIGQLAKRAGVTVQTVRFYERKELIVPFQRTDSGYRQYTVEAVRRLQFIRHAQEVGFSLREIHELLDLRLTSHTTCTDIQERVLRKIQELEQRMHMMQRMKQGLQVLAAQCDSDIALSDCPVLDALDTPTSARWQ